MKVYVFGLGHIGLPMAAWIALNGHQVEGIDIDTLAIKNIIDGTVDIHENYNGSHISQILGTLIKEGRLSVSTEFKRQDKEPAVFVIAVGIRNRKDGSQDISPIRNVLDTITPKLLDGDIILLRTTMIPGICEQEIIPRLKTLNKKVYFAYSPETISETHAFVELNRNPNILAAIDDESYQFASSFLRSLSNAEIYQASTFTTAEMTKVVQNIVRDVNIALINEISGVASLLGVDVYELRNLVNTHPRVELLLPGPGVGGYCLPNSLKYLEEAFIGKGKETATLPLMQTARQLNDQRPSKVVSIIKEAIKEAGKDIQQTTIAIIGLAMKDYCADCRYSPALKIGSLLLNEGATIRGYDPLVPMIYPFQVSSLKECIDHADCMVITAIQEGIVYDPEMIIQSMKKPPIVVDTKNTFPVHSGVKLYRI